MANLLRIIHTKFYQNRSSFVKDMSKTFLCFFGSTFHVVDRVEQWRSTWRFLDVDSIDQWTYRWLDRRSRIFDRFDQVAVRKHLVFEDNANMFFCSSLYPFCFILRNLKKFYLSLTCPSTQPLQCCRTVFVLHRPNILCCFGSNRLKYIPFSVRYWFRPVIDFHRCCWAFDVVRALRRRWIDDWITRWLWKLVSVRCRLGYRKNYSLNVELEQKHSTNFYQTTLMTIPTRSTCVPHFDRS